jgi:hypothetical protein
LKLGWSSRKSREDIVYAIMGALSGWNYVTIEELAHRTGSSREMVWRWLSLMVKIQDMPRVQSARVGEGSIGIFRVLAKRARWRLLCWLRVYHSVYVS